MSLGESALVNRCRLFSVLIHTSLLLCIIIFVTMNNNEYVWCVAFSLVCIVVICQSPYPISYFNYSSGNHQFSVLLCLRDTGQKDDAIIFSCKFSYFIFCVKWKQSTTSYVMYLIIRNFHGSFREKFKCRILLMFLFAFRILSNVIENWFVELK